MKSIEDDWIDTILDQIPLVWKTESIMKAKRRQLKERRTELESLIWQAQWLLKTSYTVEAKHPLCATKPRLLAWGVSGHSGHVSGRSIDSCRLRSPRLQRTQRASGRF